MANIVESATYDASVYLIDTADPVIGGVNGIDNLPHKALANRTAYLKQHLDAIEAGTFIPPTYAPINSPVFTGSPTAPDVPLGDRSQKIANTKFVTDSIGAVAAINVAGNANVTLSQTQYGSGILILSGALTGNISLIFPSRSGHWIIVNNATGSYNITAKTASGTGVVVPTSGVAVIVYSDGVNMAFAGSGGQSSLTTKTFSPNAGTTTLTVVGGYTPNNILLEKNGFWQVPGVDFTATDGSTINLGTATAANDQFTAYIFSSFSVANAVLTAGATMTGPLLLASGSTAPNVSAGDASTNIANTSFVNGEFVARRSSAAQAQALSDDTKTISPLTLSSAFQGSNQSKSSNGYQKLPGGLILQWGTAAVADDTLVSVTFPIAFPTACLSVTANCKVSGPITGNDFATAVVGTLSASSAQIGAAISSGPYTGNVYWMAIGY